MTAEEAQADREFKKLVYDLAKRVEALENPKEDGAEKPEEKSLLGKIGDMFTGNG